MTAPVLRRAGIVVVAAAVLGGCAPERAPGEYLIDHAWRIFRTDPTPPPADGPGWERVTLPDFWGIAIRRHAIEGWFRASIELATAPPDTWALYLPRIGQNVTAWVNGVVVGDGGSMTPPLPRNWNRPLLLTIPPTLLRAGTNTIELHLVTHVGAPGYLRPFHLGPLSVLRPLYARRTWWQVTFAQIVGGTTLAGGLLLLAFTVRNERFEPVRWIAIALVLWAWSTADAFFQEIPVPTRLWEWSTASGLIWCPVAFVLGFHRILGRRRRRLERVLVWGAAATSGLLLVLPAIYFFTGMLAAVAIALGTAVYVMALAIRTGPGGRSRWALLIPTAIVVLAGAHDVFASATGIAPLGLFLSPYLPLMAIGLVAWRLLGAHLASVEETAALNRTLELRVDEKHAELARNYERLQGLERERAVASERERIMQDVHDGVGGQLVSALALVESGRHEPEEVGDVLRGALEDLRLVIDSLDPTDCDLLSVLGSARARLEPRLQRHGLQMRWEVREVPPLPGFGPETALQVMRVVQEAVTNVVKHAGARIIVVRTGDGATPEGAPGVFVEISDDGTGCPPDAPRGRGLTSMARRAERLGGRFVLESSAAGTTVRLWMPRAPG
jgi:signal transduction histidine kinase